VLETLCVTTLNLQNNDCLLLALTLGIFPFKLPYIELYYIKLGLDQWRRWYNEQLLTGLHTAARSPPLTHCCALCVAVSMNLYTFSSLLSFRGKHSVDTNLLEISEGVTLLVFYSNSDPEEKQLAGEAGLSFFSFCKRIKTT